MSLDASIFLGINGVAGEWIVTDRIFIFLALYLPYFVIGLAVVLGFIYREAWATKIKILVGAAASFIAAYAVVFGVIHQFWLRPRPFESLSGVNQLIAQGGWSFPSLHSMVFFLLATLVYGVNRKMGEFFYVLAVLIGFGRILVGVHYPFDVLAGAILGATIGGITVYVERNLKII